VARDALAYLLPRLLNVARLLGVVQIFGQLWSESLRRPTYSTRKEMAQADQPGGKEEEKFWVEDMPGFRFVVSVGERDRVGRTVVMVL